MKKFAAIALALILAMSSMFATVAVAAEDVATVTSNELKFTGFDIVEDSGVIVDVEKMLIYGLEPGVRISDLGKYLRKGDVDKMTVLVNGKEAKEGFIGTGTQIQLEKAGFDKPFTFDVVIFGDVTGDGSYDVLDMSLLNNLVNDKLDKEADELELLALGVEEGEKLDKNDYSSYVNAIVSGEEFDQKSGVSDENGLVEIEDQVISDEFSDDYKAPVKNDDISLSYNKGIVDSKYYTVDETTYDYTKNENGEIVGTVDIVGKGLFGGTIKVEFNVVTLLEKVVATVNEVIADAKLENVISVTKTMNNGVADIEVAINASKVIHDDFNIDINGLNGLLSKIDEFKANYLQEADLTVGEFNIAENGDFDRGAIKALAFDIAKGIFCDIANATSNTVKSYSGVAVTNDKLAHLPENFNVNVVMTADAQIDIDRVKAFAAKISRYVAFDVVDGNAVVDVKMPVGLSNKVLNYLTGADRAEDIAIFNSYYIYDVLGILEYVKPEHISAGSADEIQRMIDVFAKLGPVVDKVLAEVEYAKAYDKNGKAYDLYNGESFAIADNSIGGIANAVLDILGDVAIAKIGDFANENGTYTVKFDAGIGYKGIAETVIVNIDFFGEENTNDIIEDTADKFNSIIATLGLEEVAAATYDAEKSRGLVTLNASEVLEGNLGFDEKALDGLYTDIKGYFDEEFAHSSIKVDDAEIVKDGRINKTTLKNFLLGFARGFLTDVANLNSANIVKNCVVEVTEADGKVHKFELDFQLVGTPEDIDMIKALAGKVADYVSYSVVNGTTVVNITLPQNIKDKVKTLHTEEQLNDLFVFDIICEMAEIKPEHISKTHAEEIEALVNVVCGVDAVVNKLLGKIEYVTAYDVNGKAYNVLAEDAEFVIGENSIEGIFNAVLDVMDYDIASAKVGAFKTTDGIYSAKFDVATSVAGIKETVVVNVDIF